MINRGTIFKILCRFVALKIPVECSEFNPNLWVHSMLYLGKTKESDLVRAFNSFLEKVNSQLPGIEISVDKK